MTERAAGLVDRVRLTCVTGSGCSASRSGSGGGSHVRKLSDYHAEESLEQFGLEHV